MTAAIRQGLRERLNALPNQPPTAYENVDFTPVQGTLWMSEFFLPAATDPLTLAPGNSQQHDGVYQVSVYAPLEQGTGEAEAIAAAIVAHFARGTVCGPARVMSSYVNGALTSDGWYQIPVTINYRAYIDG